MDRRAGRKHKKALRRLAKRRAQYSDRRAHDHVGIGATGKRYHSNRNVFVSRPR